MGTKNLDSIPAGQWRRAAETVGAMYEKRWTLIAVCRTCRLEITADLAAIILKKGPGFSLWNQTGKCRRRGCHGVVDFRFQAPGMGFPKPLVAKAAAAPQGHVMRAFDEEEQARQLKEPPP
jgi:hypothetical protein